MNKGKTQQFAKIMHTIYIVIIGILLTFAIVLTSCVYENIQDKYEQEYGSGYTVGYLNGFKVGQSIALKTIKESIAIAGISTSNVYVQFDDKDVQEYGYSFKPQSDYDDNFGVAKTYEHYGKITCPTAKQTKLNNLSEVYTDDYGFRKIGDYYLVALGSYYGDIGDIFVVTLSEGRVFLCIKGDAKADQHTDVLNQAHLLDGSVVEFIVDAPTIVSHGCKGDCSIFDFKGSIVDIQLVGHYSF